MAATAESSLAWPVISITAVSGVDIQRAIQDHHAVNTLDAQVCEHHVEAFLLQRLHSAGAAGTRHHRVTGLAQGMGEVFNVTASSSTISRLPLLPEALFMSAAP